MTKNRILKNLLAVNAVIAFTVLSAPAAAQGKIEGARSKISNCIGCHEIGGYKASFPTVYSVPMIHGQTAKYLENAMQAYKKGDRSHPTMRAIAGSLSDADIVEISAYFAGEASKVAASPAPKK